MSDPKALIEQVLDFLNAHKIRATYTAVGEAIGVDRTEVGKYLGERRPRASWVVYAGSGEPAGYDDPADKDPSLFDDNHVIDSGHELLGLMQSSLTQYR